MNTAEAALKREIHTHIYKKKIPIYDEQKNGCIVHAYKSGQSGLDVVDMKLQLHLSDLFLMLCDIQGGAVDPTVHDLFSC